MNEVSLRAYLATALTGLGESERRMLFADSDCIAKVCQNSGILLYQPREHTDPLAHANRPAREVYLTDRDQVATSDLVVALCSLPSFGVGMEIEIATAVGIPVVYLIKKGSRLSRMVEGTPGKKRIIEYADSTELVEKLSPVLAELEPRLLERRRKYLNHDKNLLASRLRDLRERSGFSLAHLGTLTDLTVEQLESFERDDVRVSLITVEQLRTISEALGVPGSYLLGEMQYLKDLVAYRNLDSLRCYARTHNLRYPVYEELWSEYQDSRNQIGFAVKTRDTTVLTEEDWGKRHEAFVDRGRQRTLDLIP